MAISHEQFPTQVTPPPLPRKEEIVAENIRRRASRVKTSVSEISPIEEIEGEQNDADYMEALKSDITRLQIMFENNQDEAYIKTKGDVLKGIFRRLKLNPPNAENLQTIINAINTGQVMTIEGTADIQEADNIRHEVLGPTENETAQAIAEVKRIVAERLPAEKQRLIDEASSLKVKFSAIPDYNEGNRTKIRAQMLDLIEAEQAKFNLSEDLNNPKMKAAYELLDGIRNDLEREELREKLLNIRTIEKN
jgi:hypothetical protein